MLDPEANDTVREIHVEAYETLLRDNLGDELNEAVLTAIKGMYRAGWNDCYKLARRLTDAGIRRD